jgi:IS30 family transposase
MKKVKKLTFKEREEISRSFAQGVSVPCVAHAIGREPSSIYRELERTGMTPYTYRAYNAQVVADSNRVIQKQES